MNVENALNQLQNHISKHTNNKYQNTVIDTKSCLKQPMFTLLSASNYLARYLATEGEKRGNVEDLLKACHFILFEVESKSQGKCSK